jgi:hypothetical protein
MEKAKQYILPIMFMLIPFGFLSFGIIHKGQQYALILCALPILAAMIENRFISSFLIYAFLWQVFIFIYALVFPIPVPIVESGLMTVIFFTIGGILYLAVAKSKVPNETFYNFICVATILQTLLCLSQYFFSFDPVLRFLNAISSAMPMLKENEMTGSLGNPNFVAGFLAISLPFFFRKSWYFAIPFIVFILWKTMTSAAAVPACIGIAVYLAMKYRNRLSTKKVALVLAGGFLAALIYAFVIDNNIIRAGYHNNRFDMWWAAVQQVVQTPFTIVFGFGPGAYWGQAYPLHSEWVQMFHQFGIIGLILLIGYVLTISRKNIVLFSAFVIAMINMAGNYPLHLAPSAFLIIIIAALIERDNEISKYKAVGGAPNYIE